MDDLEEQKLAEALTLFLSVRVGYDLDLIRLALRYAKEGRDYGATPLVEEIQ